MRSSMTSSTDVKAVTFQELSMLEQACINRKSTAEEMLEKLRAFMMAFKTMDNANPSWNDFVQDMTTSSKSTADVLRKELNSWRSYMKKERGEVRIAERWGRRLLMWLDPDTLERLAEITKRWPELKAISDNELELPDPWRYLGFIRAEYHYELHLVQHLYAETGTFRFLEARVYDLRGLKGAERKYRVRQFRRIMSQVVHEPFDHEGKKWIVVQYENEEQIPESMVFDQFVRRRISESVEASREQKRSEVSTNEILIMLVLVAGPVMGLIGYGSFQTSSGFSSIWIFIAIAALLLITLGIFAYRKKWAGSSIDPTMRLLAFVSLLYLPLLFVSNLFSSVTIE